MDTFLLLVSLIATIPQNKSKILYKEILDILEANLEDLEKTELELQALLNKYEPDIKAIMKKYQEEMENGQISIQ